MTEAWVESDPQLFFSKKDPLDRRLGDFTSSYSGSLSSVPKADLLIWGYPDHEGIALNKGRLGAAEAPHMIRHYFYKMTPHVLSAQTPQIFDLGDISTLLPLAERHNHGAYRAQAATEENHCWASLGGGHDYGYADGAGFLRASLARQKRPLVINFDAHLDVRDDDKGFNSGTPFFRLLREFSGQFDFFEVGLQPHCNSQHHWHWAQTHGAQLLPLWDLRDKTLLQGLKESLKSIPRHQPLWISLDIDSICSAEAPGCSQSWTTGLKTVELIETLAWLSREFSWKAFSIYEVSPPLDQDHRTSKLAAQLMHHFLSLQLLPGEKI